MQRAGVKAQSKGGIPVAHLPPGGSAVCRSPRHPGQDAGEGCHHCEWALQQHYMCVTLDAEKKLILLCPLILLTGYFGLEERADFLLLASASPPVGAGGEVWDSAGQQGPQWRTHAVYAATLVCWNRRNSQGMLWQSENTVSAHNFWILWPWENDCVTLYLSSDVVFFRLLITVNIINTSTANTKLLHV